MDKRLKCLTMSLVAAGIMFYSMSAHSTVSKGMPYFKQGQVVSDKELLDLAVKKKVIPEQRDESYIDGQLKEKNSVNVWIVTPRDKKLEVVNALKALYSKDGVVLQLSNSYYVDEINGVLYNSLESGEKVFTSGKGIGHIVKTIAVMDGDYNNGKDKVELAKEVLGPDLFEFYKATYPKKYEKLLSSK